MLAALMAVGLTAGVQDPAACASIEPDAARLACYDSVYRSAGASAASAAPAAAPKNGSAPAAVKAGAAAATATAVSPPAASAASVPADPVADFGLTEKQKQEKQPDAKPRAQQIEGTVKDVKKVSVDRWAVTLENGQVWVQLESTTRQPFKNGDSIRIKEGAMNSYLATGPKSGGAVRVRRVR